MCKIDSISFNPELAELVDPARLNELGPGRVERSQYARLKALSPERLMAPRPVQDQDMAQACLAGLWLLWDFLDESHAVSQSLPSAEGSYWHGIMHRREPDYENARYWFRRVGEHPIHVSLVAEARRLAADTTDPKAHFLRTQETWDPFCFVDLCESVERDGSKWGELCRRVQQWEWRQLFLHCLRRAAGEPT